MGPKASFPALPDLPPAPPTRAPAQVHVSVPNTRVRSSPTKTHPSSSSSEMPSLPALEAPGLEPASPGRMARSGGRRGGRPITLANNRSHVHSEDAAPPNPSRVSAPISTQRTSVSVPLHAASSGARAKARNISDRAPAQAGQMSSSVVAVAHPSSSSRARVSSNPTDAQPPKVRADRGTARSTPASRRHAAVEPPLVVKNQQVRRAADGEDSRSRRLAAVQSSTSPARNARVVTGERIVARPR